MRLCSVDLEAFWVRLNVEANRHFAAGRVWARLLEPKPGLPQSVRLSDGLGRAPTEVERSYRDLWLRRTRMQRLQSEE